VAEPYQEVEDKLRPLLRPLPPPGPYDWLAVRIEPGQTFAEYQAAPPFRKSEKHSTLYLCLFGDQSEAQRRILDLVREYLPLFFACQVSVRQQIPLASIPVKARRLNPASGSQQVQTGYILREILQAEQLPDALGYVGLTASDIWSERGPQFVFGEGNARQRIGVWSIFRNGDPAEGDAGFRMCLARSLGMFTHEFSHFLTFRHCTASRCLMNGSNHPQERDARPLHLCPVCLHKLCWNLQVEPVPYLTKLKAFCRQNHLDAETAWYEQVIGLLS